MSRTHHITRNGPRPHRQVAPSRLTREAYGDWYYSQYERRPLNAGGSTRPSGGYASERALHALYKKLGRRRERRRRNQRVQ